MDRLTKLERKMGVIARWFGRDDYHAGKVRADFAAIDAEPTDLPPARALDIETVERVLDEAGVSKVGTCAADRIQALIADRNSARASRDAESRRAMAAECERDDVRAEITRLKRDRDDEAWMHAACLTIAEGGVARADEPTFLNSPAMDAVRKIVRDLSAARTEIDRLEARDREARWIAHQSAWGYADIVGIAEWQKRRTAYLDGDPPKPDPLLVEARDGLLALRERAAELFARIGGAT